MSIKNSSFFEAAWPAPASVRTLFTTRLGGVSLPPYSSFNLGTHVGDKLAHVEKNRELLFKQIYGAAVSGSSGAISSMSDASFNARGNTQWLSQVHGTDILDLRERDLTRINDTSLSVPCADGVRTHQQHQICVVLTADCLPVLMCNRQGTEVAAIHAGWQGLAKGILSEAVKSFSCDAADVFCYLGPAISSAFYEVGEDVLCAFQQAEKNRCFSEKVSLSFTPSRNKSNKKYMADLYGLARSELNGQGCSKIYGGELCTYDDSDRFFSYRRDGVTGRMASLIWIE